MQERRKSAAENPVFLALPASALHIGTNQQGFRRFGRLDVLVSRASVRSRHHLRATGAPPWPFAPLASREIMTKAVGLLIALFALWLALSGYFKPFLLTLGILSCLFTVLLAARMKLLDEEAVPLQLRLSLLLYWGWLGREVFKSAVAVSKVILAREMSISQQLIAIPCTQKTEMGHVIFANSITLTPGTVTVEAG
ncbi:MAG: hypothetical protein CVT73_23930, partial [Alphaproteobacteria bacterium HGW-Alphaproteobacteria-12]